MKTKLTDNFGNDQLDENGCVQYVEKAKLSTQDFIKTVESLLQSVKDNYLSPEDFMERLNSAYNHFGQVTHENHKPCCPQCGFDEINECDLSEDNKNYICGECGYEDIKDAF